MNNCHINDTLICVREKVIDLYIAKASVYRSARVFMHFDWYKLYKYCYSKISIFTVLFFILKYGVPCYFKNAFLLICVRNLLLIH